MRIEHVSHCEISNPFKYQYSKDKRICRVPEITRVDSNTNGQKILAVHKSS